MIKILFCCHGNICRSPMAEFVMKDLVKKAGKDMAWVERVLKDHNATLKTTWLLTVDGRDHILFLPKEGTQ